MDNVIELYKIRSGQRSDECPLFGCTGDGYCVEIKAEGEKIIIMAAGFECSGGWRVTYPGSEYTRDELCAYCSCPFSAIMAEIDAENREGVFAPAESEIVYSLPEWQELIGVFSLEDETATCIIRCLMDGVYFIKVRTAC